MLVTPSEYFRWGFVLYRITQRCAKEPQRFAKFKCSGLLYLNLSPKIALCDLRLLCETLCNKAKKAFRFRKALNILY